MKAINKFDKDGAVRIYYDEVDLYMKKSKIQCDQKNYKGCMETLAEGFSRSNGSIYLFDALIFSIKMNGKVNEIDSLLKNNCSTMPISKSIHCKSNAIISN